MRALIAVALSLSVAGCQSETRYGKCVGVGDREFSSRDPTLMYEWSVWNAFWAIVASPMVFPPLLVLHHETYCPVERKPAAEETPQQRVDRLLGERPDMSSGAP